MINLQNVHKDYFNVHDHDVKALEDVNLKIEQGEFVAIVGHSGSGKSSLLNILGCLDRPTSGSYLLNEKNTTILSDSELSSVRGQTIGFIFQNFHLMPKRTILENVSMPLIYQNVSKLEREERAMECLSLAKIEGLEDRLPWQLSGGQQQRVAIARSLVNTPKVLLADEPTGNLDQMTSFEIMDLFEHLNTDHNISIIIVTHEKDIAARAKRFVKIGDGKIIYDGEVFIWV